MLPFLKSKNNNGGVIVKERQGSEIPEESEESMDEIEAVEECIKNFIVAMQMKDMKKMAEEVKSIHEILHAYMDHEPSNDTNYALQNARAYKSEE